MDDKYPVVIVGGGLMGSMAAHLLARRGVSTRVYDVKRPGNATWAGAGILCPEMSTVTDADYVSLAMTAGHYYHDLVERLTGCDVGYGRTCMAKVRMAGEESGPLDRAWSIIGQRQTSGLFPTQYPVQKVDPRWLSEQHPLLGEIEEALYYPDAGRVDGRKLAAALRSDSEAHGAKWVDAAVDRIQVKAGRVTAIATATEIQEARQVVLAAGFWSRALLEPVGIRLGLVPHRGQIVHLKTAVSGAGDWPILEGLRGHYQLAWPDGRVVAGATREANAGEAPYFTAEGQHEVLREAFRVTPGLGPAEVLEWRVGLRPASSDGRPILGAVPDLEGLFLITGHGAGGLLCGPYSSQLVVDQMLDGTPINPAFSPGRFC